MRKEQRKRWLLTDYFIVHLDNADGAIEKNVQKCNSTRLARNVKDLPQENGPALERRAQMGRKPGRGTGFSLQS